MVGNSQAPGRAHRQPHQEPLQLDPETQNGTTKAPIRDRAPLPTGEAQEAATADGLLADYYERGWGAQRYGPAKEWSQELWVF